MVWAAIGGALAGALATNLLSGSTAKRTTAGMLSAQQEAGIFSGNAVGSAGPSGDSLGIGQAVTQFALQRRQENLVKSESTKERENKIAITNSQNEAAVYMEQLRQGQVGGPGKAQSQHAAIVLAMEHAKKRFPKELAKLSAEGERAVHDSLSALHNSDIMNIEKQSRDPKLLADRYSSLWKSIALTAERWGLDPGLVQGLISAIGGGLTAVTAFNIWKKRNKKKTDERSSWSKKRDDGSVESQSYRSYD